MHRLFELLQKKERTVIGIMSGTSLDGVDLACVRLQGSGLDLDMQLVCFSCYDISEDLRNRIRESFSGGAEQICRLHYDLGRFAADLVIRFCEEHNLDRERVDLIGWHGQTVYHCHRHSTLQLGEADIIAQRTNIPVIYDFRAADIAAGGCGAPLVPYVDKILFAKENQPVAVQNLGGIGNVTYISPDPSQPVIAFDTGPGNVILNELVELYTNGEYTYDHNGLFSINGVIRLDLLKQLLDHEYFSRPLPKSTGREEFGRAYVEDLIGSNQHLSIPDLIRTAVSLTTYSIHLAYKKYLPQVDKIYLSGGGANHPLIIKELKELFGADRVDLLSNRLPIPVEAKEAVAFAIFAHEKLNGALTNLPSVTGAEYWVSLGKIALPLT